MQLLVHENMSTTLGFYVFVALEMMTEAMIKAVPSLDRKEKLWNKKM